MAVFPRRGSGQERLERAYTLTGQPREALETLLKEMGEDGASFRDRDPAQSMKLLYRKRLERTLGAMKTGLSSPYNVATICMAAGERNRALEFLKRAYNERDPMLVTARADPVFDGLRADPRFADLLLRRLDSPR